MPMQMRLEAERIDRHSVLEALRRHIGHLNGASAATLVEEITGVPRPNPLGERQLREVVTELRMEGHHVCAHPATGYFIAESQEELDATCLYLHDRAMASLTQVARMRRVSVPDLRGQLRLPVEQKEEA